MKLISALLSGAASGLSRETHGSTLLVVKQILVQVGIAAVLWTMGIGWTWFLWMGTLLTSYMWVVGCDRLASMPWFPISLTPMSAKILGLWTRLGGNGSSWHLTT